MFPRNPSGTTESNWAGTQSQASSPQIYTPQGVLIALRPFDPQIKSSLCQRPVLCFCIKIAVYLKVWMLAGRWRECGPMQQFPLDRKKTSKFSIFNFYNRRRFYFFFRIKYTYAYLSVATIYTELNTSYVCSVICFCTQYEPWERKNKIHFNTG